jgi:tRNA-splicing ligase RtcB (3'-phosphate/5'-hydroxy nucleic acid ligase)
MQEKINDNLFSWASILDIETRLQAEKTARMPFIYPHMALMSDAHLGKGATVGSVIPTEGAIIPAAVGVDIGCGMMAVKINVRADDLPDDKAALHEAIAEAVPSSAGRYNNKIWGKETDKRIAELRDLEGIEQANAAAGNWDLQLGSLGSGNHFIEVSLDEEDYVWLFLHSGSRGVGNKLAQKWIKVAREQCRKRFIHLEDQDLAYLVEGEKDFWDYMEALRWAQRFAYLNREEMMWRVESCFADWYGNTWEKLEVINCHHNYTAKERHFGKDVWLSRKGAIDAHAGVRGLIPGSMGDASYVVTGLGNPLALCSSPHGAGRVHSRSKAKVLFDREDLDKRMEGIAWGNSDSFLDEHPLAYKPVEQVMQDASDLVSIDHTLRQIVNVKGN